MAAAEGVLVAYMLVGDNKQAAVPPLHYAAYFRFNIDPTLDSFDMSKDQILTQLWEILPSIDTYGLANERDLVTSDILPDNRFAVLSSSDLSGRVTLDLISGSPALADQIYAEFVEAARLQFEAAKIRAANELATLRDLATAYDKRSEFLAERLYKTMRFLNSAAVRSGSFRYVDFSPIQHFAPTVMIERQRNATSPAKRSVIISVILGLIFASVFVIVRMEIKRRGRLSADGPS
ncbi:hypothetical protein [Mesorhizobium sp. A623]